jgi:hypothetical protein
MKGAPKVLTQRANPEGAVPMIADYRTSVLIDPAIDRWRDGRGLSPAACNAAAALALNGHTRGELLTFCEVMCTVGPEPLAELLTLGVLSVVPNPNRDPLSNDCHLLRLEASKEGR